MSGRGLDPQHLLTATPPDAANRQATSRASEGEGWSEGPGLLPTLPGPLPSIILSELLDLTDESSTALVMYPAHPVALRARSTIDLHGAHIGQTISVGANQCMSVGANQSNAIGAKQTKAMGADRGLTMVGTQSTSVAKARTTSVGEDDNLAVGKNLVISAADPISITRQCRHHDEEGRHHHHQR